MKKKISVIILLFSFIFTVSCNNTTTPNEDNQDYVEINSSPRLPVLTKDQMVEDFDFLFEVLSENYPFLEVNQRMNGIDWLSNEKEYREKIESSNTMEYFERILHEILRDLNNGHTQLVTSESYHSLLGVYQKESEFYKPWIELLEDKSVVERYNQTKEKQNTKSINPYFNSVTTLDLDENTAYIKIPTFDALEMKKGLSKITPYLQTTKDKDVLIIDIRNNHGGSDKYWMTIVEQITSKPIIWSSYHLYRGGEYSKPFIESSSGMDYEELPSLSEIEKENSNIDLDPEIMDKFDKYIRNTITISPNNSINYEGKIYLLVNDKVFSSSEKFAIFTKETEWATLVGQKTRGDGIGTDPIVAKLPNSGFLIHFPIVMGLTSDGLINEEEKTVPHVIIETEITKNFQDDPVILFAINHASKEEEPISRD